MDQNIKQCILQDLAEQQQLQMKNTKEKKEEM